MSVEHRIRSAMLYLLLYTCRSSEPCINILHILHLSCHRTVQASSRSQTSMRFFTGKKDSRSLLKMSRNDSWTGVVPEIEVWHRKGCKWKRNWTIPMQHCYPRSVTDLGWKRFLGLIYRHDLTHPTEAKNSEVWADISATQGAFFIPYCRNSPVRSGVSLRIGVEISVRRQMPFGRCLIKSTFQNEFHIAIASLACFFLQAEEQQAACFVILTRLLYAALFLQTPKSSCPTI